MLINIGQSCKEREIDGKVECDIEGEGGDDGFG